MHHHMPKPAIIRKPQRVTLYLSEVAAERGREVSRLTGTSLSQLVTDLLVSCDDGSHKVRVYADFPAHEYSELERHAEESGMSVESFVRVAAQQLLSTP